MHLKTYLKFWIAGQFLNKKLITEQYSSIFEIDYKKLQKQGIKLIIFDYDNTISCYHDWQIDKETDLLLDKLKKMNFKLAILSNSTKTNIAKIKKLFKRKNIYISDNKKSKPHPNDFLEIMKIYKTKNISTAMIGDRVTTDIYGAYLAGIKKRILVQYFKTSCPKIPKINRIINKLELLFIKSINAN